LSENFASGNKIGTKPRGITSYLKKENFKMKVSMAILWILLTFFDYSARAGLCAPIEKTSVQGYSVKSGIQYYSQAGVTPSFNQLDLYYRDSGPKKGTVVFVHGGSWVRGNKSNVGSNPKLVNFFLDRGYALVSVNYRYIDPHNPNGVRFSDQAADIAKGIAWVYSKISQYGPSGKRIIIFGHSSGAHMVALLNTDRTYLEKEGVPDAAVIGAISSDVHAYDIPLALKLMVGSPVEQNIGFLKRVFLERERLAASPTTKLDAALKDSSLARSMAPSLILSAGGQQNVSNEASEVYLEKLKKVGVLARHKHFPLASHMSLIVDFGDLSHGPTQEVCQFIEHLEKNVSF
jgi:acetyl esterase/lipase